MNTRDPKSAVRVLVVDDEPLAREGVQLLLAKDRDVELVGEAGNGRDAVQMIKKLRPDVVFLDVQMPAGNGFQVLEQLGEDVPPAVVFVTAFDRYALDAFGANALDYVLKPLEDSRFANALDRAKAHVRMTRVSTLSRELVELLAAQDPRATVPSPSTTADRIVIKDAGRVIFVDADDVDWIESADYYVQIHTKGKVLLHRETMLSLEERLDVSRFVRVHRTAIVNFRRVRELRRDGRDLVCVLDSGVEIPVSRSCRERLEKLAAG